MRAGQRAGSRARRRQSPPRRRRDPARRPARHAYQIHSPTAVIVDRAVPDDERPRADAIVTATPGLVLGIVTADCAPVLLADVEAGVIAAAHAGWRGAVAGVTDQAIAAMLTLGARVDRIVAAIGPCIARASYEVDHAFAERLLADDPGNDAFLSDGPRGQPHFDLEAYVAARLAAAGVRRIEALGLDTYAPGGSFLQLPPRHASRRADLRPPVEPDRAALASFGASG